MTAHAIRQHSFGGPDTLRYEEVDDPAPGEGQVRIAVAAAGVHLLDTKIRAGTSFGAFAPPTLPMTPGREVAGTVDALGRHVDRWWRGRRVVAHLGAASGGYASLAVADVAALFPLPDQVDAAEAVAMVGTGRTAMAILDVAAPTAADIVLVTAAAGGIGALLVRASKYAGATVVAAAGSRHKCDVASALGADLTVDYTEDSWIERAPRVTLALDGVGGRIGRGAFDLVEPGGRMVLYGYASGEPTPLATEDLFTSGVTVSAAIGARLISRPGGIKGYAEQALAELAAGRLRPLLHPPYPLADAGAAHRDLEQRATTGKVVLVPQPPLGTSS